MSSLIREYDEENRFAYEKCEYGDYFEENFFIYEDREHGKAVKKNNDGNTVSTSEIEYKYDEYGNQIFRSIVEKDTEGNIISEGTVKGDEKGNILENEALLDNGTVQCFKCEYDVHNNKIKEEVYINDEFEGWTEYTYEKVE